MPREKEAYRDNLEQILAFTKGAQLLNVTQVCNFCGIGYRYAIKRFPFKDKHISAATLARELS